MGYRQRGKLADWGRHEPLLAAARRTTRRVGEEIERRTVERTPVAKPPPGVALEDWIRARHGRLPGTLKESWKVGEVEVLDGGRRYRIDVYTNDPIAPHVEYPTLPHIIVPRRPGGILRFWTALGETVYATIVHHPGSPGVYMLTTAIEEVRLMWQQIGAEELAVWAREQARVAA